MTSNNPSLSLLSASEIENATPEELKQYHALLQRLEFLEECEDAKDLRTFAQRSWELLEPATSFVWNWHLDYIAEHLQLVRSGAIRRLIINVPPQTSKSRFVTVFFPAWWWSSDPSRRFLSVSYSGGALGLATAHSMERRRVLDSEWYKTTFGNFAWTQFTQQQYENDIGGRMVATSTGATATGKGFHVLVLDDLLNPKKAESDAERATALKFVDQTLRSRLSDQITGAIIIVEQRLHEEDVTGHMIKLEPGVWTHIRIPMEAEEDEEWRFPISRRVVRRKKGELLWPARFPASVVESLKRGLGKRAYGAQYQQRPSPAEGIIFNPTDWRYYVRDPKNAHDEVTVAPQFDEEVMTVDCAFKEATDSDNVAIQAWGCVGPRSYMTMRNTCKRGYSATKWAIREMKARRPRISVCLIEDKANGSAVIEELKRANLGMTIVAVEPEGGKVARAWAAQPEQEAGNCYLPEDDPEQSIRDKYLGEGESSTAIFVGDCAKFPVVEHDDDIDAFTQFVNWRRGRSSGLFELWKQQAESQAQPKSPALGGREVGTPEEEAQRQSDAQMVEASKASSKVARVFGAPVENKTGITASRMSKPMVTPQTPKCEQCGNVNLTRSAVAGPSGDVEEKCGACGASRIILRK